MPSRMSEIASIKAFFESHQVILCSEWLESCVAWCKEQNLNPNYTITDLQYKIYEQWLLLDLRDVEIASLPPNISNLKKYTLTENYSLQIMKIVDISKPKLWQIQKIRNNNALTRNKEQDNTEAGIGKRVLLVTLTDGVQDVEAMEFRPISTLNINSRPGLKVRLMGPITIRRGRLMLEEHNIKILGGEVEEIVVKNAAENILARALDLPENPKPFVIDESMLTANTDMFTQGNNRTIVPPVPRTNNVLNNKNEVKDEEMQLDEEINMLLEVEKEVQDSNKKRKQKTPDMFDDEFEDINEEEIIKNSVKNKTKVLSTQSVKEEIKNHFEDLNELCDDVFSDFNLDMQMVKSEEEFVKIKDIKVLISKHSIGIYKLNAKFKSIVKKLTVTDEQLHLVINIEDDTDDVTVQVHSEIIAGFAGYTPAAFMSLKGDGIKKDENLTRKVIKALKDIKEKLVNLNGNLEIKLNGSEATPIIMKIL